MTSSSSPRTKTYGTHENSRTPRRSPAPDERRRDAEASRRRLLAAALDEFSERGFAGARVSAIAERAGLNKQLINYYFNDKEGLYRGLQEMWAQREADFSHPDLPLDELAERYLRDTLAEPRLTRLLLWRGLASAAQDGGGVEAPDNSAAKHQSDVQRMAARKGNGELAEELDPGAVLVVLMGAITAPIATPQRVLALTGMDPKSPEFEEFYAAQLRLMIRHLAVRPLDDEPGDDEAGA